MVVKTPDEVQKVLSKLDPSDREVLESFIQDLKSKITDEDTDDDEELPDLEGDEASVGDDFPPIYESGDDYDKAGDAKQAANDLKESGDWEGALEKYTEAVLAAPPSALLYANRAQVLFKLSRFKAAERDCNLALKENPDSAKALRIRGKARKELNDFENALSDLSASQAIDYEDSVVEDLKFLTEKRIEKEKQEAEERIKQEEKLRKRAEDIKRAREDAKREKESTSSRSTGGMPDMGGMGGMPGMGGMSGMPGMGGMMNEMMQDPELMEALQKPKVQAALSQIMTGGGDPAKMAEFMSDPEVGPIIQKFMNKMAGGMGGGAGGMPSGFPGAGAGGPATDDDIPDLDDLPDLE